VLVQQTCKGDLSIERWQRSARPPDRLAPHATNTEILTMNASTATPEVRASTPDALHGYKTFTLGSFNFRRDEYFAHISWTTRDGRPLSHTMDAGNFLRALMRDVAWGFSTGGVNFDHVFGTTNHYKTVDLYAGTYNVTMKSAGVDLLGTSRRRRSPPPSRRCSTTGPTRASTRSLPRRNRLALRPAKTAATRRS